MKRLPRRDEFDDVFDQMQKMFEEVQDTGRGLATDLAGSVPVDIQEEDGEYTLSADLPGVEKEEINIRADEDSVEISAESNEELKEENEKYIRRERRSRSFRRIVAWPQPVEEDSITAEYEDGVLKITAEKQEDGGKQIEIN
ncbi:MAG: Hsp20/alpha crystallin family protein [Candidatus Nanohalobium sp.]